MGVGKRMKYLTGMCSDIGIIKKVNQDAALVRQAETSRGDILFAVVCDGMGGLEKGELASSTVIAGMSDWFEQKFPHLLYHNFTSEQIKKSWIDELIELDNRISEYGKKQRIDLGTTITALLLVEDAYYICNVGDSRIYYLNDQIRQMTRDQSYVQQEIDMGRMTEEEALYSSQRNMLLQCVGAGTYLMPDFYFGEYKGNSAFLLCTDGFRHVITDQEIWDELRPDRLAGEQDIEARIRRLVELVKVRQEKDNITAVLIHAMEEDIC